MEQQTRVKSKLFDAYDRREEGGILYKDQEDVEAQRYRGRIYFRVFFVLVQITDFILFERCRILLLSWFESLALTSITRHFSMRPLNPPHSLISSSPYPAR